MNANNRSTEVALVIDDDPFMRRLARDALERIDLQVVEAKDGEAGLAAIAALRPDIVLLDIAMPGIDGLEVCRMLRRQPGGESIPVLMCTGHGDTASIAGAYDAGATDFICKPVIWPILEHRVRYMLDSSASLRRLGLSQATLAEAELSNAIGNWRWEVADDKAIWSDEILRICGATRDTVDASYQGFMRMVHPDDRELVEASIAAALDNGVPYDVEHRLIGADGTERIVHGKGKVVADRGSRAILMHGTLQDVTERKTSEARLNHLACYDALTNIPNRNLLGDRVTQAIAQAQRAGGGLAMLCLDIDGFKFINDSLGHGAGDILLQMAAAQLQASVRACDTVARLGGDEFVVVLLGIGQCASVGAMARKILDRLAAPFMVEGHQLYVTASIGVAMFPDDGNTCAGLLRHADAAMHNAKGKGRNGVQFYTEDMGQQVEQRVELESALRLALERREFELHYQPKIDLSSGRIFGVEALLRWHRPGHGMVPPVEFIALAEETGLIVQIGEWVLRTACAQLVKWHASGHADMSMAVNLSARQFWRQNVADMIRQVLIDTGLKAQYLELELTESVLINDSEAMVETLCKLKDVGVSLALDDFGTGYSSLSYLKRFPIDVLKIDRSFIQDVTINADDASLTRTIILLAQSLQMRTVAEGVENGAQLEFLKRHKCDAMQGYYFSRAVPAGELALLLQVGQCLPAPVEATGPRRTLLLVDDEPNVLAALSRLFRTDDYQVLCAGTPDEAFTLLATNEVQVILSDQCMPLMTGTELLARVSRMYPETMRMILSGHTELRSVLEVINHGAAYRFFTKPWDDRLLRDSVREAFHHQWLLYGRTATGERIAHRTDAVEDASGGSLAACIPPLANDS